MEYTMTLFLVNVKGCENQHIKYLPLRTDEVELCANVIEQLEIGTSFDVETVLVNEIADIGLKLKEGFTFFIGMKDNVPTIFDVRLFLENGDVSLSLFSENETQSLKESMLGLVAVCEFFKEHYLKDDFKYPECLEVVVKVNDEYEQSVHDNIIINIESELANNYGITSNAIVVNEDPTASVFGDGFEYKDKQYIEILGTVSDNKFIPGLIGFIGFMDDSYFAIKAHSSLDNINGYLKPAIVVFKCLTIVESAYKEFGFIDDKENLG